MTTSLHQVCQGRLKQSQGVTEEALTRRLYLLTGDHGNHHLPKTDRRHLFLLCDTVHAFSTAYPRKTLSGPLQFSSQSAGAVVS